MSRNRQGHCTPGTTGPLGYCGYRGDWTTVPLGPQGHCTHRATVGTGPQWALYPLQVTAGWGTGGLDYLRQLSFSLTATVCTLARLRFRENKFLLILHIMLKFYQD